jgi:hypothetical protein
MDALEGLKDQHKLNPMTMNDIYMRCKMNRNIINQSLGGNAKFSKFKNERQSRSRYSSTSQINEPRT